MKVSYNWLKNYLAINESPEILSTILTDIGLEVEGIEKIEAIQGGLSGVVIGEVLTCEKHPDADKLKVTTVNLGEEIAQIVCGAPNVAAGQKVVVATVGCTLYPQPNEPFKIKAAKIRGVESFGMLCAEDELGLGKSHDGIMVLPSDTIVGTPAASYFQLEDDAVFEIGLTPNRADAMGIIGVAREVKAYLNFHNNLNLTLNWPETKKLEGPKSEISIEIKAPEACTAYAGIRIDNVTISPSPEWLQNRLRSVGLTPINNVVDVTNFVMRELGTPLHAFDGEVIGNKVVVQLAEKDSLFTSLDGVERKLLGTELMITDGKNNLCIAGVFGGLNSGVSNGTKSVFLESARFDAVAVRKAAKAHGLHTDASFRFERGVDPELTLFALRRAAQLILEIAGGNLASSEIYNEIQAPEKRTVIIRPEKIRRLNGIQISDEALEKILIELDFEINQKTNNSWEITSPNYRVDVTREVDVAEEILRIYGFNKVPIPAKWNINVSIEKGVDENALRRELAAFLVGKGANEVMNNSLTKVSYAEKFGGESIKAENAVQLLNPLSQDLSVMRQSLLFGLLENAQYNRNRQRQDLNFFEFGKVYNNFRGEYVETEQIGILLTGALAQENWSNTKDLSNFFDLKGLMISILNRFGIKDQMFETASDFSFFNTGVELTFQKIKLGYFGLISKDLAAHFDLKNDVLFGVIDWKNLVEAIKRVKIKYAELPKTFVNRRDFSLLVDKNISYADLEKVAKNVGKKMLVNVGLFDVYEGKNLEANKKSYALSFYLQNEERTLTESEIDDMMLKIRTALEKECNAQLRG